MWIEVEVDGNQRWLVNFDQVTQVRRQYESKKAVLYFQNGNSLAVDTEYATLMRLLDAR